MKSKLRFSCVVFIALASVIFGYFGFLAYAPDKTSTYLIPMFLFCFLLVLAGALVLVGSLIYTVRKVSTERKRSKEPAK